MTLPTRQYVPVPRVVIAPDKFRGTATAAEVASAMGDAARRAGWAADLAPVSDGGEGFCAVLGGRRRALTVTGPLRRPVEAAWFDLGDATAALEAAMACGLALAGGAEGNDPVRATTAGAGELIAAAVKDGARHVLVGVGGSATTDGGWGALETLEPHSRLAGVEITVACDVRTRFVDAAGVFGPQKGASPTQVELLTRRLERLAQVYRDDFGVDVAALDGSGAAGGLAGGLAALGASLVSGFDVVAERIDLAGRVEGADLVIAGEGYLDEESFNGKAVGGVAELAAEAGVPLLIVAGDADPGLDTPGPVRTLVAEVGRERAMGDTLAAVADLVAAALGGRAPVGSA